MNHLDQPNSENRSLIDLLSNQKAGLTLRGTTAKVDLYDQIPNIEGPASGFAVKTYDKDKRPEAARRLRQFFDAEFYTLSVIGDTYPYLRLLAYDRETMILVTQRLTSQTVKGKLEGQNLEAKRVLVEKYGIQFVRWLAKFDVQSGGLFKIPSRRENTLRYSQMEASPELQGLWVFSYFAEKINSMEHPLKDEIKKKFEKFINNTPERIWVTQVHGDPGFFDFFPDDDESGEGKLIDFNASQLGFVIMELAGALFSVWIKTTGMICRNGDTGPIREILRKMIKAFKEEYRKEYPLFKIDYNLLRLMLAFYLTKQSGGASGEWKDKLIEKINRLLVPVDEPNPDQTLEDLTL